MGIFIITLRSIWMNHHNSGSGGKIYDATLSTFFFPETISKVKSATIIKSFLFSRSHKFKRKVSRCGHVCGWKGKKAIKKRFITTPNDFNLIISKASKTFWKMCDFVKNHKKFHLKNKFHQKNFFWAFNAAENIKETRLLLDQIKFLQFCFTTRKLISFSSFHCFRQLFGFSCLLSSFPLVFISSLCQFSSTSKHRTIFPWTFPLHFVLFSWAEMTIFLNICFAEKKNLLCLINQRRFRGKSVGKFTWFITFPKTTWGNFHGDKANTQQRKVEVDPCLPHKQAAGWKIYSREAEKARHLKNLDAFLKPFVFYRLFSPPTQQQFQARHFSFTFFTQIIP